MMCCCAGHVDGKGDEAADAVWQSEVQIWPLSSLDIYTQHTSALNSYPACTYPGWRGASQETQSLLPSPVIFGRRLAVGG